MPIDFSQGMQDHHRFLFHQLYMFHSSRPFATMIVQTVLSNSTGLIKSDDLTPHTRPPVHTLHPSQELPWPGLSRPWPAPLAQARQAFFEIE